MDFYIDQLLSLPNITVANCQQQEGLIFLTLDFLNQGISGPHCLSLHRHFASNSYYFSERFVNFR